MIKNYLLIAVRHLLKRKWQTLLNILGLAVGMACCLLIYLFVRHELSYESHHENGSQVYRVTQRYTHGSGTIHHFARCAPAWAPLMEKDFAQVTKAARINQARVLLKYGEKQVYESQFFFADTALFQLFTLPLVTGDGASALAEPFSLLLTETMAEKYFPDENPLGKNLAVVIGDEERAYKITGVLADLPENSHLQVDFLASFASQDADFSTAWYWMSNFYSYLLLEKGASPDELAAQFPDFIDKHLGAGNSPYIAFVLQPLKDIHLHSQLDRELAVNGDITYVYVFSIIAVFILLLASINFTNISTARSIQRAKEVGMRKVFGASKGQLVSQFLGEALLQAAAAMLIAILVVEITLPAFNAFSGKNIALLSEMNGWLWGGMFIFTGLTGLLAGLYPAFFLAAFRPVAALRGGGLAQPKLLRKALVVMQFAISIALIAATLVVFQQLDFLRTEKLGMNKDQVIAVSPMSGNVQAAYPAIKAELAQHSAVSAAMSPPSQRILDGGHVYAEGLVEDDDSNPVVLPGLPVDFGFIELMEIEMLAGRSFSQDFSTDTSGAYILNRAAVEALGWSSPEAAIGKGFDWRNLKRGQVIGVTENFHFAGLKHKIEPLVMLIKPEWIFCLLLKTQAAQVPEALTALEKTWRTRFPDRPLEYEFVDDLFEKLYRQEARQGQLLNVFSLVAIVIACLGLFGLAAFTAEQRTREIGIRKVLGAKISGIVMLLSGEFSRLVLFANLIAWPLAWWGMTRWLENFPYHIQLNWLVFLLAGAIALGIAFLTVAYQAIKAALVNPVDALRHE